MKKLTFEQLELLENSIIADTDSYKTSHWLQYPPGTEYISSYIESRGGKYDKTVFFGLQIYLKKYLSKPITQEEIDAAEIMCELHGVPFNREGWEYILKEHDGYMPVRIQAIPEGTVVQTRNVLAQIVNTDPKCFWVPSYLETSMLRAIWYPTTVATNSWSIKQVIREYLEETADDEAMEGLVFKLHDFGARGVSSKESAAIGDAAHLVNFMGTDTLSGVICAMKYYNADMPAFSVPAAEHSSITTWQRKGEAAAYANMFKQFGGKYQNIAVVSDSYNIFNAVEKIWGEELKADVIDSGSTLVIRPDSGDPATVVCKLAMILDVTYGSTPNHKGYKVLNHVRILQGDGIVEETIRDILSALRGYGFSAENVLFGQGGGLLQQLDRDTCKFAFKASWAVINGEVIDVFKDPITDSGKRSKKGRLDLYQASNGDYYTGPEGKGGGLLRTVWENSELLIDQNFIEVRARAA